MPNADHLAKLRRIHDLVTRWKFADRPSEARGTAYYQAEDGHVYLTLRSERVGYAPVYIHLNSRLGFERMIQRLRSIVSAPA